MGKFGLGRGLSELKQELGTTPNIPIMNLAERVVVKQIPLNQIMANPDQPRKTFTTEELTELADSIKEKGVLQPILLRAVSGRPYAYEIVAGERRWRASKLAGLTEIPALVKTINSENAMEIALIENVQRENLNPMEEGAAYKNLMEKCGYEIADVSRLIGKSESYIRNIMRLDVLPTDVKKMVAGGQISASHARAIAVADNPTELAQQILRDGLSVAETVGRVKKMTRARNARAYTSCTLSPDEVQKIETAIKKSLKTPVKLHEKRGGAGQIILSFSSRPELYELVKFLTK